MTYAYLNYLHPVLNELKCPLLLVGQKLYGFYSALNIRFYFYIVKVDSRDN